METKLLRKASLEKLVQNFKAQGRKVLAPVKKEGGVDFAEISGLSDMTEDYIATDQSAKDVVFPRVEKLLDMKITRDNVTLQDRDTAALPEMVLLGTRPCDAAGLDSLGSIFTWDCTDNMYAAKRAKTLLISISCRKSDAKCFCTSVDVSPGGTAGSDILLTRMDDGDFIAELVSEKGLTIAREHPEFFEPAPKADKKAFVADVPVAFDVKDLVPAIQDGFNSPAWMEQSLRCIGCGACAYVCPTCACFDIQDTRKGTVGIRKRSWDSCGFSLFTLHASGHNPRDSQGSRWRQRVMHKFAYMPERQQTLGCVGCGRCGRRCSVDMNLKEHLVHLAKALKK